MPIYSIIAAMSRSSLYRSLVLALLLIALAPLASALQVNGLYSERVAVANESPAERTRAIREALESVILKVTGNTTWLSDPGVAQAINDAQRYVQAISYSSETVLQEPASQADPQTAPDSDAQAPASNNQAPVSNGQTPASDAQLPARPMTREQRYITVQFAKSLIDQILGNADIPVWESNRPSVLVWMVLQNAAGERLMLTADSNPAIMALLRDFANRRGLPIIFPLLDFADRLNLSEDEVWALDEEAIRAASARYGADSVLTARVHFTASGELVGLWQFIFQDQVQTFDGFASELQDYLFEPLDRITAQLAAYFAITPQERTLRSVNLRIDGIDDLAAYAELINYVDGLSVVESAVPTALDGTRIELRLSVIGGVQQLNEVIALDRDLLPVNDPREAEGDILRYRWTR